MVRAGRGSGLSVRGINAAKAGNNSMHSLLLLIGKVIPRRPDYVVLMHNVNDLAQLRRHGGYWNADPGRALVQQRRRSLETL